MISELAKYNPSVALDATKAQMDLEVNTYLEHIAINGGEVIKDFVAIRKMQYMLAEYEKGLSKFVESELNKENNSELNAFNVKMKVVNTPAKYDYSANKAWLAKKSIVEEASKSLKETESFIKALKQKTTIVDEETGETIEFYPPAVSSGTTVRVSLD